ncbi:MAG: hypothetical protein LQ337_004097 [Flavoplaca oasis]|nr:MAG: hypothetical protein LQ337_004097 [Flavoplaca oasis]
MDPVSAFGLAAGILQLVSVSSEAIILCHRLYKDGSMGAYDEMTEITAKLVQGTDQLNAATLTAKPRSRDDYEVLDLSQKCSELGKDLLRELNKLRLEKGRLRQAILKSVLAHRRKATIKEKQDLLEKYQRMLDTRILRRLDARSLKETQDVRCLDQSVQQLVHQLEQGNNTVAQRLANHKDILDRIEGKLDNNPRTTANQQLLHSLFFPEIDSREDQIQDASDGTCHWIFDSTTDDRPKPWSNFRKWLEHETGVYWISGKPGAGKSTLMKYIVHEDLTSQLLANWERGTDLLVVTFFFWHTGLPIQKSLEGLLRSLLYQIAHQWPGLVGFLDARKGMRSDETEVSTTLRLQKWTEQRLMSLLKRFLEKKPGSVTICAFIDGLDEFIGDEDTLLDIVRFFSKTPHCKICVSSRPEQVFRHEFLLCPKLRVQDLNRQDIERMIHQRLLPRLTTQRLTSQNSDYLDLIVDSLVDKSSGVFLWVDLVIKELIQGFKNEDTLEELQSRIDKTPDDIQGMYARSLTRSGPRYLEAALRCLHIILTAVELRETMTLLSLVLIEPEPWDFITRNELEYFTSPRFRSSCERFETRLISRCGSLLEIDDSKYSATNDDPLEYYYRTIHFMHRTAVEFLREKYKTFFLDESSSAEAAAQVARSKIADLVLVPPTHLNHSEIYFNIVAATDALTLMGYFGKESGMEESFRAIQVELISQAIGSLQIIHKESNHPWKRGFSNDVSFWNWLLSPPGFDGVAFLDPNLASWCPIIDDLSIAAYFGCHFYFKFLVSSQVCSVERMSTMLHAAQTGFEYGIQHSCMSLTAYRAGITIVQEVLRYEVNPNAVFSMKPDRSRLRYMQHASLWARVLVSLLEATKWGMEEDRTIYMSWESWEACCTDLIERLLNLGADPNTRITVCYRWHLQGDEEVYMYVEESPLAVWDWLDQRIGQRLARIEAQLRLAGATSYRCFQFLAWRDSLYPISSSRSEVMTNIMSSGLGKAVGTSSWARAIWRVPWVDLDEESDEGLRNIIQSIVAEEPMEKEVAMLTMCCE